MTRSLLLAAAMMAAVGLGASAFAEGQSSSPPAQTSDPASQRSDDAMPQSVVAGSSSAGAEDPLAPSPLYSPKPPPDNSTGLYLPSVVGGYVRSSTNCLVVGCDDGPDLNGVSSDPPPVVNQPPPGAPSSAGAAGAQR